MPPAVVRPHRLAGLVLPAATLLGVGTVLAGVIIRSTHGGLGTSSPPFVMGLDVQADALFLPLSTLALLGAVLALPRLSALGPAAHAAALSAIAAAVALSLGAARTGTSGLSAIFSTSFEAKNEYLPGLGALHDGAHVFLDRFSELVPSLPVNVAGHPPALMLLLHATGITTATGLAALCLASVVALPGLTVALARGCGLEEDRARTAGALAALSPVVLLLGVTSADAIFAAVGAAAAVLLVQRRAPRRLLGCGGLALAAFFSWALLAIGAWAALVVLRREGLRAAIVLAVGCGAAVLVLNGALALAYGYDPIGALKATKAYYELSVSTVRPYDFWLFGSPVAFGILLGPPLVAAALAAAARAHPAAQATVAVIAVATLAGFTKAETERIWLPFVPLACVAAAEALPGAKLRPVLALLAVQAATFSLLFNPVW